MLTSVEEPRIIKIYRGNAGIIPFLYPLSKPKLISTRFVFSSIFFNLSFLFKSLYSDFDSINFVISSFLKEGLKGYIVNLVTVKSFELIS